MKEIMGIPVIETTNCPPDTIYFLDPNMVGNFTRNEDGTLRFHSLADGEDYKKSAMLTGLLDHFVPLQKQINDFHSLMIEHSRSRLP